MCLVKVANCNITKKKHWLFIYLFSFCMYVSVCVYIVMYLSIINYCRSSPSWNRFETAKWMMFLDNYFESKGDITKLNYCRFDDMEESFVSSQFSSFCSIFFVSVAHNALKRKKRRKPFFCFVLCAYLWSIHKQSVTFYL